MVDRYTLGAIVVRAEAHCGSYHTVKNAGPGETTMCTVESRFGPLSAKDADSQEEGRKVREGYVAAGQ